MSKKPKPLSVAPMKLPPPINDSLILHYATKHEVDARSIIRWLAGLPLRGRAGRCVDAFMREMGYHPRAPQ